MECIFCKIVEGKIPCSKVYEDKNTMAFLDINPTKKGHTLVIPKQHHATLVDVPDHLLHELIVAVKKIAPAVQAATNAQGLNFNLNMHPAAGQSVMHAHFHIIPRQDNDGLKLWPQGKYDAGEMDQMTKKILEYI